MPRLLTSCALIAFAAVLAGCSGSPLLEKDTYDQLFAKKVDLFAAPDWAKASVAGDNYQLSPKGPVAPEDLVAADGRCAPPVEAAPAAAPQAATSPEPQPAAPADRPVGSMAGDLASAPMPAGPKRVATTGSAPPPDRLMPEGPGGSAGMSSPAVLGGIALGMSECQVVRRAGTPGNVAISAGAKGQREVVLSYAGGNFAGIYHFQSGRLKVIDAPPEQAKPVAKSHVRKRKASRKAPARTRHEVERVYVQ